MRAAAGRARWLAADRLHGGGDQPFADRRVHSAALDGRHRGRLFPRIRPDAGLRHHGLDARVADAHADDLRAASRRRAGEPRTGSTASWRARWRLIGVYARTLAVVLRHRLLTMIVMLRHRRRDGAALHRDAEGLLSAGRYRPPLRLHRGAADISFRRWRNCSSAPRTIVLADPAVAGVGSSGGRRRLERRGQSRAHVHQPASRRRSASSSVAQVIERLRKPLGVAGISAVHVPVQDLRGRRRAGPLAAQFTLWGADFERTRDPGAVVGRS